MRSLKRKNKDELLLGNIAERVKWDSRVSNSDIQIKSNDGVITLYGYFDKPYRKDAIIRIIETTPGVRKL